MARRLPQHTSPYEVHPQDLPAEASGAVHWDEVFGAARPLRVEVGVGNSSFLIEVAKRAPNFNYLGFEYSKKRVYKFLKKVEAAGVSSIRILPVDITDIIDHAFLPRSIDHVYVHHPDPWPKRRHAKKRFLCPENARRVLLLLRPGGGLSLRTDVPAYAAQMMEVLDATEGFVNLSGPGLFAAAPLEPYTTAFEAKFISQGLRIFYLEYRKREVENESPWMSPEASSSRGSTDSPPPPAST